MLDITIKEFLDLALLGTSMDWYNIPAIVEDRATLGSDLSATMAAYSMGRYPNQVPPCFLHAGA